MELLDKVVVITGGAHGIGRALCACFVAEGAAQVVIADRDQSAALKLADELGDRCIAFECDVTVESSIQEVVQNVLDRNGRIDLFCSNAGVTVKGTELTSNDDWQWLWEVNVMAHVYAARAVLPGMLARGSGYLLQTSSAAGLLTEIGSSAYSVTKHGAVSFAEWLSIRYRRKGIRVSCLCPAGVLTEFLDQEDPIHQFLATSALSPEEVASTVIEGLRKEQFLILPHPQVAEFFAFKGQDYDRWLQNFSRVSEKLDRIADKKARDSSRDLSPAP